MGLESLIRTVNDDDRASSLFLHDPVCLNRPCDLVDAIQALVRLGFCRIITGFDGNDTLRFDNELLVRKLDALRPNAVTLEELDDYIAYLPDGTSVCEWVGVRIESDSDGVVSTLTPCLLGRDTTGMWTFSVKDGGARGFGGFMLAIYKARP